jgi:hypothetical protein
MNIPLCLFVSIYLSRFVLKAEQVASIGVEPLSAEKTKRVVQHRGMYFVWSNSFANCR